MTQKDMILDILRTDGNIDPLTALRECGCFRLSGRILELRQEGYDIATVMTPNINRWGKRVSYATYFLR